MDRAWTVVLLVALMGAAAQGAFAQDSTEAAPDSVEAWHEGAWNRIVTRNGVHFDYVFYSEADTENNGVVLRLTNENDYGVQYAFTIIFRGPTRETARQAAGRLQPGEMKTGESDGLFWIPFRDGSRVGEVGLRRVVVKRAP